MTEPTAEMIGLMEDLLGRGTMRTFSEAFKKMGIAEDAITDGIKKWPLKQPAINGLFLSLMPPPILAEFSLSLYRKHCEELVTRTGEGKDVKPATDAEILAALSLVANEGMPQPWVTRFMLKLAGELFPELGDIQPVYGLSGYDKEREEEFMTSLRRKCGKERLAWIESNTTPVN